MGIFVNKNAVKKIEIEGVTFTIRPLTGGEIEEIDDSSGKLEVYPDGRSKWVVNTRVMRTKKILTALVDWDAKDDKGKKLPISEELVDSMKPEVRVQLVEKIEEISRLSEANSKLFRKSD